MLYFRTRILTLIRGAYVWMRGKGIDREDRTLLIALTIGTIPAVCAGLLFESTIETTFRSAELVAWVLIAGSGLFLLAEYVLKKQKERQDLTIRKGLVIGLFQMLALIPGMSRSGATISGGMLMGLSREHAAQFAFLLSVPIILGAGTMKLFELSGSSVPLSEWGSIAVGALAAFVAGILSIHYLLRFLKNHSLGIFVIYRIALAAVVLVLL
jgi:undecaprenyl-diphosphatase